MTYAVSKKNRYRLYSMGHVFLSSIHQGLQATHISGKLLAKYPVGTNERSVIVEWAHDNDMDIKLLSGGKSKDLKGLISLLEMFETQGMSLPYAYFRESEDNLEGVITAVGVLVPQDIYAHPAFNELNLNEHDLIAKYPNLPLWVIEFILILRGLERAK